MPKNWFLENGHVFEALHFYYNLFLKLKDFHDFRLEEDFTENEAKKIKAS